MLILLLTSHPSTQLLIFHSWFIPNKLQALSTWRMD